MGTGSSHITKTYEYTYDTAGNILTVDSDDRFTSYVYEDDYWGDKLTSVDEIEFSYDGVGNPTTYHNGTLTRDGNPVMYYYMDWEHGRQLTYLEIWGDSQDRVEYAYDVDGIRITKVVNVAQGTVLCVET